MLERDKEGEEVLTTGVRSANHPEDWKHSYVGTGSAVALSVPPVGDEWCVGQGKAGQCEQECNT